MGLYHNRRQEQAADAHLQAWLRGDFDDAVTLDEAEDHNLQRGGSIPPSATTVTTGGAGQNV